MHSPLPSCCSHFFPRRLFPSIGVAAAYKAYLVLAGFFTDAGLNAMVVYPCKLVEAFTCAIGVVQVAKSIVLDVFCIPASSVPESLPVVMFPAGGWLNYNSIFVLA